MGASGPKVAAGAKIGGAFTVTKDAPFLKERAAIFDAIKVSAVENGASRCEQFIASVSPPPLREQAPWVFAPT